MTLSTNQGASTGELKKVNIPVSVSIPTFDELFTKSGSWNEAGDAVTLKLANTNPASVDFLGTLSSSTVNIANNVNKFSIAFEKVDGKDVGVTLNASGSLEVDKTNIMDEGAYVPLTATALTYNLGGKLDVKSGKFTVNLKSLIDGATVKNYADGAEAGLKITSANGTISAFVAGSGNTKDTGLALVVNDKKYALDATDVNGLSLASDVTITAEFDAKAGSSAANPTVSDGAVTYTNVNSGTYTTVLTITITEKYTGIVTTTTIPVSVSF